MASVPICQTDLFFIDSTLEKKCREDRCPKLLYVCVRGCVMINKQRCRSEAIEDGNRCN